MYYSSAKFGDDISSGFCADNDTHAHTRAHTYRADKRPTAATTWARYGKLETKLRYLSVTETVSETGFIVYLYFGMCATAAAAADDDDDVDVSYNVTGTKI